MAGDEQQQISRLLRVYLQNDDVKSKDLLLQGLTDAIATLCSSDINTMVAREPYLKFGATKMSTDVRHKLNAVAHVVITHANSYRSASTNIQLTARTLLKELWRLKKGEWIDPPELLPLTDAASLQPAATMKKSVKILTANELRDDLQEAYDDANCYDDLDYAFLETTGSSDGSTASAETKTEQATVADVGNIAAMITSTAIKEHVRVTNIRKMGRLPLNVVAKSLPQLELLLSELNSMLRNAVLFGPTMDLLGRLLGSLATNRAADYNLENTHAIMCHLSAVENEGVWIRVSTSLCRVAPSVIRNVEMGADFKIKFVEFFRQMFLSAAYMLRGFEDAVTRVVLSNFLNFLTAELGGMLIYKYTRSHHHHYYHHPRPGAFLSILAHIDPQVVWLRYWLHNSNYRMALAKKLTDIVSEMVEPLNEYCQQRQSNEGAPSMERTENEPFRRELYFMLSATLISLRHRDLLNTFETKKGLEELFSHLPMLLGELPSIAGEEPSNPNENNCNSSTKSTLTISKSIEQLLIELSKSNCDATLMLKHSPTLWGSPSVNASLRVALLYNVICYADYTVSNSIDLGMIYKTIEEGLYVASDDCMPALRLLNLVHQRHSPDALAPYSSKDSRSHAVLLRTKNAPSAEKAIVSRLHLYSGFSPGIASERELRQWRRSNAHIIVDICITQRPDSSSDDTDEHQCQGGIVFIPHAVEIRGAEERRMALKLLSDFISGHAPPRIGAATNVDDHIVASVQVPQFTGPHFQSYDADEGKTKNSLLGVSTCNQTHYLEHPTFIVITQPLLAVDLLHVFGSDFLSTLSERLLHASYLTSVRLRRTFRNLSVLLVNLDALVELRRPQNNLNGMLLEFLHQYTHRPSLASGGNEMEDEVVREAIDCLASTVIASSGERTLTAKIPLAVVIEHTPYCLYTKWAMADVPAARVTRKFSRREEMFAEGGAVQQGAQRNFNLSYFTYGEGLLNVDLVEEVEQLANKRETKRVDWEFENLEDNAADDVKDEEFLWNVASMPQLTTTTDPIISGTLLDMEPRRFLFTFFIYRAKKTDSVGMATTLDVLYAYIDRRLKNQNRSGSVQPTQHQLTRRMTAAQMEWLTPILEYAVALGKAPSSSVARIRCRELRFVSLNTGDAAASTADWFLSALLLTSSLDAKRTVELGEMIAKYASKDQHQILHVNSTSYKLGGNIEWGAALQKPDDPHRLDRVYADFLKGLDLKSGTQTADFKPRQQTHHSSQLFWPTLIMRSAGRALDYADAISLGVFPRVIYLLHQSQLTCLREYLDRKSLGALPSLLHLLLLYSNQLYLGILDFARVEEYLIGSVLGGEEFQASHFCAVLMHMLEEDEESYATSDYSIDTFMRPTLGNFRYHSYCHLFEELWLRSLP